MPSTHKTDYLKLNQWLGSDKPKRDDWNQDNLKLDDRIFALAQCLDGHTSAPQLHVTQLEKDRWSQKSGLTTFSYIGDGQAARSFTLSSFVRFGVLFGVNKPVLDKEDQSSCYSGYLSSSGCSEGLTLMDKGFSVSHDQSTESTGLSLRFNQEQVRYLFFYWT